MAERKGGTARLKDSEGYITWYQELDVDTAKLIRARIMEQASVQNRNSPVGSTVDRAFMPKFWHQNGYVGKADNWKQTKAEETKIMRRFAEICLQHGQAANVLEWIDGARHTHFSILAIHRKEF